MYQANTMIRPLPMLRFAGPAAFVFLAISGVPAFAQASKQELDRAFYQIKAHQPGQESNAVRVIRGQTDITDDASGTRRDLEGRFVSVLRAADATPAAKRFIQEQWARILTHESVPALELLVLRSDTSDFALNALRSIKHPDAQDALLRALNKANGAALAGIIRTLGERQDPSAVPHLRRLAAGGNRAIAVQAIRALGEVGGMEAAQELDWCRLNLGRSYRQEVLDASLRCAEVTRLQGDVVTAVDLFGNLFVETMPSDVRARALEGIIRADGRDAAPLVTEVLNGRDQELRKVAAYTAAEIPGAAITQALVDSFHTFDPSNQVMLLNVFARRRDPAVMPILLTAAKNREPVVRVAALKALSAFNDPEALPTLLKAAATSQGTELEAARTSLANLQGPEINEALVSAGLSADNTIRLEAVRTMIARQATNGVPLLLRIAERDVDAIQSEAIRALGILGSTAELDPMVELLLGAGSTATRDALQQSVLQVTRRAPAGPARIDPIAKALKDGAGNPAGQLLLVQVLAELKDDASLDALQNTARRRNGAVQLAAVNALADWPNPAPLDDLERIAKKERDTTLQDIAFRGYIRLLQLPSNRSTDETINRYEKALKMARNAAQEQLVVEQLAATDNPRALGIIEPYLGQSAGEKRDLRGGAADRVPAGRRS